MVAYTPGAMGAWTERVRLRELAGARAAVIASGDVIVAYAREVLSRQWHEYRTPTPASRPGPPAAISGNLASSWQPHFEEGLFVFRMRVSPGDSTPGYPSAAGNRPASFYGPIVEGMGFKMRKPILDAARPSIIALFRARI